MNLVRSGSAKKPPVNPVKPAAAEKNDKAPSMPSVPIVLELNEVPQPAPHAVSPEAAQQTLPEQQADSVQKKTPVNEENEPDCKTKITAIVCELINQELGSVAERFRLKLTDGNLWELTRAALEDVRPEFSSDSKETEKKLERLRPQVIAAMTKAAIKMKSKE